MVVIHSRTAHKCHPAIHQTTLTVNANKSLGQKTFKVAKLIWQGHIKYGANREPCLMLLGSSRVSIANRTSIHSATFAQQSYMTDRSTGALQRGSQICISNIQCVLIMHLDIWFWLTKIQLLQWKNTHTHHAFNTC